MYKLSGSEYNGWCFDRFRVADKDKPTFFTNAERSLIAKFVMDGHFEDDEDIDGKYSLYSVNRTRSIEPQRIAPSAGADPWAQVRKGHETLSIRWPFDSP